MKQIIFIIMLCSFVFVGCNSNHSKTEDNDANHSHENCNHNQDTSKLHHAQEEFTIENDSIKIEKHEHNDSHKHSH